MEIDIISIGKRIKKRRLELHLTQTDIYKQCGIASGVLSRIENGKNVPSVIAFHKLSKALDCDMNWLATGKSDVTTSHQLKQQNNMNNNLTEKENLFLNKFNLLTTEEQEEIVDMIDFKLYKKEKK